MATATAEAREFKFLAGGGEMGERIRDFDWTQSPLGPIESWPQSLKTTVSLILNARHPMWVGWGPQMTMLYNDAYIAVLSLAKHPQALGNPAGEVWSEVWDICGPMADKVYLEGEAIFQNDVQLFMNRGDFLEETFYSFSYSPIRNESGNVAGLFCPSTEVTSKVLNTRRLRTLSELASKSLVERSVQGACASASAILAKNPDDLPFALLYLLEPLNKTARLEQAVGIAKGLEKISPELCDFTAAQDGACFWPFAQMVNDATQPQVISLQGTAEFPLGPAAQPVSHALMLPVISRGQERPVGILIAGVNPARKLDAEYRMFYELVAGQVAAAIQNARAVEEEKRKAEALAELDRAKTVFFNNISHELRTPLTLILSPLEEEMRHSPAPNARLELIHRNSMRLLKLVNTLLDFSRIEAGQVEPSFEATDLAAYTAELASVFRSLVERAGLRFIVDCAPLPQLVYVDRDMWEKILFNLLSNAFKFTMEGEIEIKLCEINVSASIKCVSLSVRDTGTGIPAAELPRVFERFHRVLNTRSRSHEGAGIGLALVQELARLLGGSVKVESTEGQGSTFSVSIPMGRATSPKEGIGARRPRSTTGLGSRPFVEESLPWLPKRQIAQQGGISVGHSRDDGAMKGERRLGSPILLADDDADMRDYVRRLLTDQGYNVRAVENGRQALESARSHPPALVLSDVMMPEMDGFELLHQLRTDPATRAVPIILLSARAGAEARMEGAEGGADDYVTKPFSARELLARVATHLKLARIRKEAEEAVLEREERLRLALIALQRSEEKTRVTLDSITDGLHVVDARCRLTFFNDTARRLLAKYDQNPDELIGQPFFEVFPVVETLEVGRRLKQTLTQREPTEAESFYEPWKRWFRVRHYPTADGGVSTFFQDITDIHDAAARIEFLSQLTHKLSTVSDAMEINRIATKELGEFLEADGCYFFQAEPGRDVRILPDWRRNNELTVEGDYQVGHFGSPELCRQFEVGLVAIDDVTTCPWTKDFAAVYEPIKTGAYCIAPMTREGLWIAALGVSSKEPRHWLPKEMSLLENVMARVWPLIERARVEGKLRAANALLLDKASHLEALVQQRTAKLRESIGELEAFSYSIAHDMRAPLRSLQGFSEILLTEYGGNLNEEGQHLLLRIGKGARRMDQLIQDVLNYSRVMRAEFPLAPVDVEPLINSIIEIYPNLGPDKAEIRLEGPFPAVLGNEAMLTQIFSNFMGNAVKFVAAGAKPSIQIRAESGAAHVRFCVQDNGIGIAADQQEKIFGMFQQVSKDFEGTGIGLAIVKKAAERMGGRVWVQSDLGQGSTFWIELQRA